MVVIKVEPDMITSIIASLIGLNCDTSDNVCQDLQN